MRNSTSSISSLLLSISILLIGVGLLNTLLGVRGLLEGFSETVIGFIMSSYFLGFIVGTYLCPTIIRRVGHIRTFTALAAIGASATLCHALLVDAAAWAGLRFVTGICMVGLYMVVESWLNAQTLHQRRGRVFAWYMAITLAALAFSQFFLLIGEKSGFIPFILAALMFTLGLVPIALTEMREPRPVEVAVLGLAWLYRISPLGVAGAFSAGLVGGAFWGMGAVFGQGIGLTAAGIAGFLGATIMGGALLQWPIGHLSDRHDRRHVLMIVCVVAAILAILLMWAQATSMIVLFVCSFLFGGFFFSIYSLSVAHVNDYLGPADVLPATQGLLLINGIGAALGPVMVGWCMDRFGLMSLLVFFALVCVMLGVFALYLTRQLPTSPIEQQGAFVAMTRTSPMVLEMDPRTEVDPEFDLRS